MAKRPVLGRGLAALLGETAQDSSPGGAIGALGPEEQAHVGLETGQNVEAGSVIELPVTALKPNPRQPRRSLDPDALEELAGSIAQVGIVQPVIVRPVGEGYELIAGERRWRAAQRAGFTVVPAIVRQASDVESLELALVENVVRQELSPIDEALALKILLDDLGVTQENLAARVGKSRSAIANKVRLLDLPAPIQESLSKGALSEGHGRALLGLESHGDRVRLARKIEQKGLSVRQVEAEVRRITTKTTPRPPQEVDVLDPEVLDDLREVVFAVLGVMPRVRQRQRGGVIELPFSDPTALRTLVERLRGEVQG